MHQYKPRKPLSNLIHRSRTAVSVLLLLVSGLLPPVSAQDTETGTIAGAILPPPGSTHLGSLFVENLESDVVTIVPIEPGQQHYEVHVVPGTYRIYGWLPDHSLLGGFTRCIPDPACTDHALVSVQVDGGQVEQGIDIGDWRIPASPIIALSGQVLDGNGGDPIGRGVVLIWERHILEVGPESEVTIPFGAVRHWLPGATIMPGFINTHVHNAFTSRNLERWAEAGVTTVRDLGAPVSFPWDFLRNVLNDDPHYARVLAAGPLVTCPGGYPIVPNGFPSLTIDSEAQARDEIDALIDRGADVIKIVIESGVQQVLSLELATAIVDTAHTRDIPVTVHLNLEQDLRTALDAGVDDVAHIVLDHVDDELINRMVANDVGWVPTIAILGDYGNHPHNNLRRFVDAGGRVAMGNDAGYLDGLVIGMPIPELEGMQQAGMTPMQIIVASTSDAAVICRRQDLIGTLAPGMLADVLVVEGDPLEDLHALEAIRLVIHEGTIIRHEPPPPRELVGRAGA